MKRSRLYSSLVTFILIATVRGAAADYLSPIAPPGDLAARMPTLSQVEPRQVIDSLPFIVTNSGAYLFTRTLVASSVTDCVTIQAGSVTLDMKGFSLLGMPGSGSGITVSGARSFIIVRNGVIASWAQCGLEGSSAHNSKLVDVLLAGNGADGVRLGTNSTITGCTAAGNTANGFNVRDNCIIMDSVARGNGGVGFLGLNGCIFQKCVADRNQSNGFDLQSVGQISHCTASENTGRGFNVRNCCSVLDSCSYGNQTGFWGWDGIVFSRSVAYLNTYGFYAAQSCTFSSCSAYSNTYQGVYGDVGCSIDNCTAYGNWDGIGARNGSRISSSSSYGNSGSGYWIGHSTSLEGCSSMANSNGVTAQAASHILKNTFRSNTGAAIQGTDACRIEGNHIAYCGTGVKLTGTRNILSGNTLLGNTTDYDMVGTNQLDLLISELPFTISWPAKARVTGSLTGTTFNHGIWIVSDDVSLDLDGHTLTGVPNSYYGIVVAPGYANVDIRNGTVRNWGWWGVGAAGGRNVSISDIKAFTNGYTYTAGGINAGTNCLVRNCLALGNSTQGIQAEYGGRIIDCSTDSNGATGINAGRAVTVTGCAANRNGAAGIAGSDACRIASCSATGNTGDGFQLGMGNSIESCQASQNSMAGIRLSSDNRCANNSCDFNGYSSAGYGIYAVNIDNTIDGNSLTDNGTGLYVPTGNLVIRNHASGSATTNFLINAGSTYGPIVTGPGQISTTSPWANFSF